MGTDCSARSVIMMESTRASNSVTLFDRPELSRFLSVQLALATMNRYVCEFSRKCQITNEKNGSVVDGDCNTG